MIVWVDAQLPPQIAAWMCDRFGVDALAVRDLGLRDASDESIYRMGRDAQAVVMTKDSDFCDLAERLGSPPQVLWLTCGNTSNTRLREILSATFDDARRLLARGDAIVEISGV
jgi:predicted nuclease of predicted toxin-antitoxin system